MFCLQPTPTSGSGAAVNPGGFWRETMVNPLPGWQSFERWPSRPQSVCSFTCYTPVIVSLSISPWCSVVKASACNVGDLDSIPGSGRSPGEGNGNPLQYSCLENPMVGGAWWATVHGVAKSQTQLSDFTFTFTFRSLFRR